MAGGSRVRLSVHIHGATPLKPGLCRHLAKLSGVEAELDV
jgi:hypothetical protein